MNFAQKIYFNDTPLVLTINKADYLRENPQAVNYTSFTGATLPSYEEVLQNLEQPGASGAIVEDISPDILMKKLQTLFRRIDAGGGVAYNEQGEILMIYRRGKWDLPKGKLDEGETIDECALREVKEETGLKKLTLGPKICDTWHIYMQKKEQILKRTAWYKMAGTATDKLRPQKDEQIMEAKWVKEQNIAPLAAQSYEAVRDVLRQAGVKW